MKSGGKAGRVCCSTFKDTVPGHLTFKYAPFRYDGRYKTNNLDRPSQAFLNTELFFSLRVEYIKSCLPFTT